MTGRKMTVGEFLKQDIDIDVCDDVSTDFSIAFVGPLELTDAGREHFGPVLGLDVCIGGCPGADYRATVIIGGDAWPEKLRLVEDLFDAAAGCCLAADYEKWFHEKEVRHA